MSGITQGYLDVPLCDHCLREIKVGDQYVEFIADKPVSKAKINTLQK